MFLDQAETILPGIVAVVRRTAVDHDGQLGGAGQFHLPQKDSLLHIARRVVIEVVQPDFAPGNYFGMPCQSLQLLKVGIGGKLSFVRMNANRGVEKIVLFCELDAAIERPRPIAVANRDDMLDPSFPRASNHLLAVRLELLSLEMSVRINEHNGEAKTVWDEIYVGTGLRPVQPSEARFISAASPRARLRENCTTPAGRLPQKPPQSCRSTPVAELCDEQGLPRRRLYV